MMSKRNIGARRCGALLAIVWVAMGLRLLVAGQADAGEKATSPRVLIITISGGINSGSEDYVREAIDRAEKDGYGCLVLELDTPGGGLKETQTLVKKMLQARVPVVVYVWPKGAQAASAGTFLTMAAHVAAMAPGTRIGAAHPVQFPVGPGKGDREDSDKGKPGRDIMMEKVENDTASFIVGVAKQRGRNAQWAERAVRESVSITSDVAVAEKVVDLEASSLEDLLTRIDGRQVQLDEKTTVVLATKGAQIQRREMSMKQGLLNFLADPNILMVLLAIAGLGIMMEFYHPGAIFPGVVGVICGLLAFVAMQILPINYGGLVLLLAGIGLFIAEVYVSSFGLLGVAGAICFLVGGILLVNPSSEPHYLDQGMSVDLTVLFPLVIVMVLAVLAIGYVVMRAQGRKVETGEEGMRGLLGEAKSDLTRTAGKVFVHGEYWNAAAPDGDIPIGSRVEVLRVEGMLLHVRKIDK